MSQSLIWFFAEILNRKHNERNGQRFFAGPPRLANAIAALSFSIGGVAVADEDADGYAHRAQEVTRYIVESYWDADSGLYSDKPAGETPAAVWPAGVMFSALVAATRHDRESFGPLLWAYYRGLDQHWDTKAPIPGYEPYPTQGGGNDKYYDDNAWLVISLIEAYEVTRKQVYLNRAKETMTFVISGHDMERGGGIWWHERHLDGTKNTCVNAPAAVGCLLVSKYSSKADSRKFIEFADDLVEWTKKTLQLPNGLYADRIEVESGKIHDYPLTYNTALMIRAHIGLYRATGEDRHREEAIRLGEAAIEFVQNDTQAYRDEFKWSHLMLEADLALYRFTGDQRYYERARAGADFYYKVWGQDKPDELIEQASIARALWLMADMESPKYRDFWEKSETFRP